MHIYIYVYVHINIEIYILHIYIYIYIYILLSLFLLLILLFITYIHIHTHYVSIPIKINPTAPLLWQRSAEEATPSPRCMGCSTRSLPLKVLKAPPLKSSDLGTWERVIWFDIYMYIYIMIMIVMCKNIHTYIHIYIYIYNICVCIYMYICVLKRKSQPKKSWSQCGMLRRSAPREEDRDGQQGAIVLQGGSVPKIFVENRQSSQGIPRFLSIWAKSLHTSTETYTESLS